MLTSIFGGGLVNSLSGGSNGAALGYISPLGLGMLLRCGEFEHCWLGDTSNSRREGSARLRALRTSLTSMGMSGGATAERKLSVSREVTIVAAVLGGSGSISIGRISPTGGEWRIPCTNCRNGTTPLLRPTPTGSHFAKRGA